MYISRLATSVTRRRLVGRGWRGFSAAARVQQLNRQDLLKENVFIGGKWVGSPEIPVLSKYDDSLIGKVPDCGAEETQEAIGAAVDAFECWGNSSPLARSAIVGRWGDLVLDNREDLATLIAAEQGKPWSQALDEVVYGAHFLTLFGQEVLRQRGETIPSAPGTKIMVQKVPVGVVGAITPWNFPLAMITRKCGAAIAAGCPVVLKPSELTPFSAMALGVLGEEAGMPDGVFNVVVGADAAAIGTELCTNPSVRKITFTGSTRVGKLLMAQSASTVKRVSMELGGNAPFIVFEDADLDRAVSALLMNKLRNAGQACVAVNRVLVHDAVYSQFHAKLKQALDGVVTGDPFWQGEEGQYADQGPLINDDAFEKLTALMEDAAGLGAHVEVCGTSDMDAQHRCFPPVILGDANAGMRCHAEEVFGPLFSLFRFSTEQEAVELANDTTSGLSAYFCTQDAGRMLELPRQLQYGMVGCNVGAVSNPMAPFSGVKESGMGIEGSHYALDEYSVKQSVHLGL